ncbi:hypothetical protein GP486_005678 [Trichoglossum hirsutum]|uniref:Uncharacterized protein n=1 Tax=Trichoglossum hirsutum TaxID=265104 RepID=A0A9P8L8P7_9PEZI|nr:hypothetical protein GP486_005678 [Trichoglossum hirsutum]
MNSRLYLSGQIGQGQPRRRSQRLSFARASWLISRTFEADEEDSDAVEETDISNGGIDNAEGDINGGEKGVQADDPQSSRLGIQPPPVHNPDNTGEHIVDLTTEESLLARIADLERALSSTMEELSAALKGRSSALKTSAILYRILFNEPIITTASLSVKSDPRVLQAIQDMEAAGMKHKWEEAVRENGDESKL